MTDPVEEAVKALIELRRNDPVVQRARRRDLERCFKIFWDSNPDEETFVRQTDGLLFTPRMIYYMTSRQIGMQEISLTVPVAPGKGGKKR